MEVTLSNAYLVNLLILFTAGSVERHFHLDPMFFLLRDMVFNVPCGHLLTLFNCCSVGKCFPSLPILEFYFLERFLSSFLKYFFSPCSQVVFEARLSEDIFD